MRIPGTASLLLFLLALAACGGGGSNSSPTTNGPLTGNWQLNLVQEEPRGSGGLSITGFLVQGNDTLTGSVATPPVAQRNNCAGVSAVNGTINGQSVTFSVLEGGTTLNFTGTISSDNKSMSGDYQGAGGGCFTTATSGTWNAFLVPPLNGSFTGTINSGYMETLQGAMAPVPVMVSGSMTQSSNVGTSTASLSGTISAVGYPCFSTATLSGTISGQGVYLQIFGYNGEQIGRIGLPSASVGTPGMPATVETTSTGVALTDSSTEGLFLGVSSPGPCPPLILSGGSTQTFDSGSFTFNFQ